MADVSKSVEVLITGNDSGATAVVDKLTASMGGLDAAAKKQAEAIAVSAAAEEKWADSSIKADIEQKKLAESTKISGETAEKAAGGTDKLATALKAIATAAVVKAFIDANAEAENFEKSMTLLTGSSEKASAEFKFVSDTASSLGFKIFDLTGAYANLSAATKGTALEGQATKDVFFAVANGMDALGKSSGQTTSALDAIAKIASNTDASLKTLKSTLDTSLPGAFKATADEMGLTTDELDKLLKTGAVGSEQVIPALTDALNKLFGNNDIDTYSGQVTKLQNALSLAFIEIGKAGTMDALTKAVEVATAATVGAVAGFTLLGEVIGIVVGAIANGDIFTKTSNFGDAIDAAMAKAAASTEGASNALLGYKNVTDSSAAATSGLASQLGINAIGVKDFADAQTLADAATKKASDSSKVAAEELKKLADEEKKAEENAAKLALELEKLASNEKIKAMEFTAKIQVAGIEADAKKVVAAFDSINNTITSSSDLIGSLLSDFDKFDALSWSAQNIIKTQLDIENKQKAEAFELQKQLVTAQINAMNATTSKLIAGDALIKIDGAGLQPQLEAFMWEILKAVQVKVNQDGLKLLLGV